MARSCDAFICGAGIAGVSVAYQLAVKHGLNNILLVDERPPLSLTTDNSTECYRNWWPGPGSAMVSLMNRSIDLLEELADESGNVFHLNRRGYLYLTSDPEKISSMEAGARQISALGAGPLRIHSSSLSEFPYIPPSKDGYANSPAGADLILDASLIKRNFPYLDDRVVAALHVRRAGWLSAQQLGIHLLQKARESGVELVQAAVVGVDTSHGRVTSIRLNNHEAIHTDCFINAAGPFQKQVAGFLGIDLPVYAEFHQKLAFNDTQGVLDRSAPMLIWTDTQRLDWSPDERDYLEEDGDLKWLLGQMPAGVHTRPDGGQDSPVVLMLWEYHNEELTPVWPLPFDPQYPDIVLRGLMTMLPGLRAYLGRSPRPRLDGGYYIKTRENRPIIGPLIVPGSYIIGGLSGFGIMAACAASELLAAHILKSPLPSYSYDFLLDRYNDPVYLRAIEHLGTTGQL